MMEKKGKHVFARALDHKGKRPLHSSPCPFPLLVGAGEASSAIMGILAFIMGDKKFKKESGTRTWGARDATWCIWEAC